MKTGSAYVMRLWSLGVVVVTLLALAGMASAQTPDDACAADSLYLISPPALHLELQTSEPRGMVVSWPNLELTQATCYTLTDTAGLGFQVDVSGGFGDKVDRVFKFRTDNSGVIGAAQASPLLIKWQHEGSSRNGSFEGLLNLANNGGVWRYHASSSTWDQVNDGLPMTWKQVNIVALAEASDGTLVAGMTRGQSLESDPAGLYLNHGAGWTRVAPEIFDSLNLITQIAVSPEDSGHFLVGTAGAGLFVTRDGGRSFTQLTMELDPGYNPQPSQYHVRTLAWLGDTIFVFVQNLGVFSSRDGGGSFTRLDFTVPSDLDSPEPVPVMPVVNSFSIDPARPGRILASLQFHGVYESTDGGTSWHDLYGDLVVPDPETTGAWVNSALAALADPDDENVILMSISQKGLIRTLDGGQTWSEVGADVQPENRAGLTRVGLLAVSAQPGLIYAIEDGFGILRSEDFGSTWTLLGDTPALKSGYVLLNSMTGNGDLLLGTYGGGVYVPGTILPLADTYSTGTSLELRNLDLGLEVAFSAGVVEAQDEFRLVCQTFQGWAVWRAPAHDRGHPVLLGLYDRVNPETCLEGYCGDTDIQVIPQCFAAKRAACFDVSDPDTIRFFDQEVYNGFAYYYSVTSFDYGNTAMVEPENNSNPILFSPRWGGDVNSPFRGQGNQSYIQVNMGASVEGSDQEIYVFPNPLRPGAGIPGEEGKTVVFTNLPPESTIRIFTTSGDDIMELGPENQRGGQIYWNTENDHQRSIAPGIYLYRVDSPGRSEFWGKLIVIR